MLWPTAGSPGAKPAAVAVLLIDYARSAARAREVLFIALSVSISESLANLASGSASCNGLPDNQRPLPPLSGRVREKESAYVCASERGRERDV